MCGSLINLKDYLDNKQLWLQPKQHWGAVKQGLSKSGFVHRPSQKTTSAGHRPQEISALAAPFSI